MEEIKVFCEISITIRILFNNVYLNYPIKVFESKYFYPEIFVGGRGGLTFGLYTK